MNRNVVLALSFLVLALAGCDPRPPCPQGFVANCDGETLHVCVAVPQTCWTALDCPDDYVLDSVTCAGSCVQSEAGSAFCALDAEPDDYCSKEELFESTCHQSARVTCRYGYATAIEETCTEACVEYEDYNHERTLCALDAIPNPECTEETDSICRDGAVHECVAGYVTQASEPCGEDTCVSPYQYGFCSPRVLPVELCASVQSGIVCHGSDVVRCVGGYPAERGQSCDGTCVEPIAGDAFCSTSETRSPVCEGISSSADITCSGLDRVRCRDGYIVETVEACSRACVSHRATDGKVTSACTLSEERDPRCESRIAFCDGARCTFSCFDGRVEAEPTVCRSNQTCQRELFGARCQSSDQ